MTQAEQTPIGNLNTENTPCSYLDDNPLLTNCTTGNVWFLYKSWVAFINAHGYRQRSHITWILHAQVWRRCEARRVRLYNHTALSAFHGGKPFTTKQMHQNYTTVFSGEHQRFLSMAS